ncbi:EAL domain, c-di-GMP-specific phosphodiesterase class I (or its enzymatically inactive variant) [Butyrivibrio fibrisolvens]|uniref:EAL domain, c-di-GMP-specific phosphodiesterase class I (Or its enzymatically inactive variant) n=1 Tax=Butyrivibrio fibrisolvens TaxID=831 RepID=A0A1H9SJ48_BUTFI|nr:EAL domain-containing protein [Butyrivibrio fibrisolvens]SER84269.1 EAL domain, c-di-GMP-specific phosphodiesterase class I (or its enzymatically inactive variant) [Butyrivibrio fibrisolvens]
MSESKDVNAIYEHVVSHIDDAISNGWIKAYYQPVIRGLTGQLCSAESLARWIDPEYGLLAPDKFISALEASNNIHKLDCFLVDKVCSDIHEHMIIGKPTFPVSINFSRLDFIMCDMLDVVETAVMKYDIPRDYLHFEITESMIAQDEELMKKVITDFRNRGYEIWMDDFGSGYSSLNLLKDYDFDLVKMDMRFLSDVTEKSKSILRSAINLAKQIGIKTLSEGVETKEQIDFLLSVGCGKLQGYYYGKPQPYDEMLKSMADKHIEFEQRQWRSYYEAACLALVGLDRPVEIIEYDGYNFKTLFMNEAYKKQISLNGYNYEEIDRIVYNSDSPLMPKYRKFADKTIKSKGTETFFYTSKGNYYQLKATYLADNAGKYLFRGNINNISLDQNTAERDQLNNKLKELNHLHETVLLINKKENITSPLLGGYNYIEGSAYSPVPLDRTLKSFEEKFVYPEDRESFKKFMSLMYTGKKDFSKEHPFAQKTIRVKQEDGSYLWRDFAILPLTGTGDSEYLLTISAITGEMSRALDKLYYPDFTDDETSSLSNDPAVTLSSVLADSNNGELYDDDTATEYARLWYSLIKNSSYKLFWKDKDRRFRGVSKSFLDFYEIKSLDDIIGKTDEEMHWHVDDGPYQGDELDVLGKGLRVYNAPGQCIVNGVVHNIICNKVPIYKGGKIIGLVGSFADVDEEIYRVQKLKNPTKLDTITRLMNTKAFIEIMMDYAIQYNDSGRNYAYIILHNSNQRRIEESYGKEVASSVIRQMGEKIIDVIKQSGAASRLKESYFAIIIYIDSKEKLDELTKKVKEHIESINKVDGKSVTLRINTNSHLRTDPGLTDETIYPITLRELEESEGKK